MAANHTGTAHRGETPAPIRWYQTKRLPLWLVVGGTVCTAAYYFQSRGSHPAVEMNKNQRMDPLPEERPGSAAEGEDAKQSAGRQASRAMGMHKGMETEGIFSNKAMAKKVGEIMPDPKPKTPNPV